MPNRVASVRTQRRVAAGAADTSANKMTQSERIRRFVEDKIFCGELKPGDRLDEVEIANKLQVSRTPVREALQHLVASGLVHTRPHHGSEVATLSIPELIEMFEVMAELEGLCARTAARRITPAQRRELEKSHHECAAYAAKKNEDKFYAANQRFHEVIYRSSHNRFLESRTMELRRRVAPYRRYVTYQPGRMVDSIEEHRLIMEAILAGQGAEAHDLMRKHINLLGGGFADFISVMGESVRRTEA